mmetsp:Transcript_5522/g.20868  ORF Transcript_5522/g.20868 Transcript_5522/m.20868 type:complete len:90 (+) Transcript_5522:2139-2408(+)
MPWGVPKVLNTPLKTFWSCCGAQSSACKFDASQRRAPEAFIGGDALSVTEHAHLEIVSSPKHIQNCGATTLAGLLPMKLVSPCSRCWQY